MKRTAASILEEVQTHCCGFWLENIGKKLELNDHCADGDVPLHVLAWQHETDKAAVLIAAGADVNALGDMSTTALHVACIRQNIELIRILLQAGANPDTVDEFGRKALADDLCARPEEMDELRRLAKANRVGKSKQSR